MSKPAKYKELTLMKKYQQLSLLECIEGMNKLGIKPYTARNKFIIDKLPI